MQSQNLNYTVASYKKLLEWKKQMNFKPVETSISLMSSSFWKASVKQILKAKSAKTNAILIVRPNFNVAFLTYKVKCVVRLKFLLFYILNYHAFGYLTTFFTQEVVWGAWHEL